MTDYLKSADILLPQKNFFQWSVIACDQFTSEPRYWEQAVMLAGSYPSTLYLTLPERYLEDNAPARIEQINQNMRDYLAADFLSEHKNSMIYVSRQTSGGVRKGLVGLIDLEQYDYSRGSRSLIRATEATVVERIPPRVEIRRGASMELPHVLLLVDDPDFTVIEPIAQAADSLQPAYDFNLMLGGGHISGHYLSARLIEQVNAALGALLAAQSEDDRLLFAVGDGNHSLAAARECYLLDKSPLRRYSLVEVVNIHDPSIEFEPIYRVVFGVQPEQLIDELIATLGGEYQGADAQRFECVYQNGARSISLRPASALPVGTLQGFLDEYLKSNSGVSVDYIHGTDSVRSLCAQPGRVGFIFDGMKKNQLFSAIRADGSLPRKTFSMGHARDKRYYMEARRISK